MNNITKTGSPTIPWGEDPHSLVKQNASSEDLAFYEEKASDWYRLHLRSMFETNQGVREILRRNEVSEDGYDEIAKILSSFQLEETAHLFEKVLRELLREHDRLKKAKPGLYIVNSETGKLGPRITSKDIFQPPDFVDEGGNIRKSTPTLDPRVSVPLVMGAFEGARMMEKVSKPGEEAALAHISNPEIIQTKAETLLEMRGWSKSDGLKTSREIEFGKEASDGIFFSTNPRFHRSQAFAHILAHKIQEATPSKQFLIVSIEERVQVKNRWYVAKILT